MARSNGAMVCGIMMMMMMVMGAVAQAPAPSVDCQTVVLTLTDCLGFVGGNDTKPTSACCQELSSVVGSSPQCLCLLFNTTFTDMLGINVTRALQLPTACRVSTPPTSLCSALGIPVPAPVGSPGIAPSPVKTPASPPMAPSPISSSPSPTTGPISSSPSSTATPALVPSGSSSNASTTAPPPSSAPAITSQNVGIATALLLLSSFFFS